MVVKRGFLLLSIDKIKKKQNQKFGTTVAYSWAGFNATRPDTQLPKSQASGQGPYLRSLDHLGRSSKGVANA